MNLTNRRHFILAAIISNILKEMINVEENNIACIKAIYLTEKLKVSRTAIYSSLKMLELKGYIKKLRTLRDSYRLNEEKLQDILNIE